MSGSKVVEEEFLLLRTVWPNVNSADNLNAHTKLGLEAQFLKAEQFLEGMEELNNYLDAIDKSIPPKEAAHLGVFWLPYEQQQRLNKFLHPGPIKEERAYRQNEELVNTSFVNFLQAVCAMHPEVSSDWNPARINLNFDFKKVKEDKKNGKLGSDVSSLSCQVDGFLESQSSFRAQAILEAKAEKRPKHEPHVSWQETMEMVTALLNEDPKRALLQDRGAYRLICRTV